MKKKRKAASPDKYSVIRINRTLKQRLDAFKDNIEDGNKFTVNETLERVLEVAEQFIGAKLYYTNEIFTDVTEARGDACIRAVRTQGTLKLPSVVIVVGEDSP